MMLQVSGVSSSGGSVPAGSRSPSEPASLAHLMTKHLAAARPRSDAEALRLLRQAFPGAPLAARVAAMAGWSR
ncbi:MAG: putative transferase [Xanthobacteraceae bacterium]|jgi:hypothetical protein|nr:putative transferase [Xanthobacteraceae bacterium]